MSRPSQPCTAHERILAKKGFNTMSMNVLISYISYTKFTVKPLYAAYNPPFTAI